MHPADRKTFISPLLTTVEPARMYHVCRVCKRPIKPGDPIRSRAWHMDQAHEACGWFLPHEGNHPVQRRKPGSFVDYWEWRCPECKLDACAKRAPLELDDLRCGRCKRPRVGDRARFIQIVIVQGVRVPIGMGCWVRGELRDGWAISFSASKEVHSVPFGSIVRDQKAQAATEVKR